MLSDVIDHRFNFHLATVRKVVLKYAGLGIVLDKIYQLASLDEVVKIDFLIVKSYFLRAVGRVTSRFEGRLG